MDQGTLIFVIAAVTAVALGGGVALYLALRTPRPSTAAVTLKPQLLKACGPISARQAVHLARAALKKHAPPGALRGLCSGSDLDHKGLSCRWTVTLETHAGQRTAVVRFGSSTSLTGSALVAQCELLPTPPRPGKPLTDTFEDSPAALANLMREGADFHDGAKATLAARPDQHGRPVWKLDVQGRSFETPFVEAA
ncbi:MAG: hypothetical protein ACF8Q5_05585 [Phycisphaerales bacterium JB040]